MIYRKPVHGKPQSTYMEKAQWFTAKSTAVEDALARLVHVRSQKRICSEGNPVDNLALWKLEC
jgi:hypothetical protein